MSEDAPEIASFGPIHPLEAEFVATFARGDFATLDERDLARCLAGYEALLDGALSRDKLSIALLAASGGICLSYLEAARRLALAVPPEAASLRSVVARAESFIGMLVPIPVVAGDWQDRIRSIAATLDALARSQSDPSRWPWLNTVAGLRTLRETIHVNADVALQQLVPALEDGGARIRAESAWRKVAATGRDVPGALDRLSSPSALGAHDACVILERAHRDWLLHLSDASDVVCGRGMVGAEPAADPESPLATLTGTTIWAVRCFARDTEKVREAVPRPPRPPVKVSPALGEEVDALHVLRCATCGAEAVRFEIARYFPEAKEKSFVFHGITHQEPFPLAVAPTVLAPLVRGDVAGAHGALRGGIDAYCPRCDRVYCREHYQRTEWSSSQDNEFATCPEGHTRMIDD